MIVVAALMARNRTGDGSHWIPLTSGSAPQLAPRLMAYGAGTGILAGFFGIGGGILVVPGLVAAADLPPLSAVESSFVSVTACGITTAANYAWSGLIDWRIVALFVAGGVIGSAFGGRAAASLAQGKKSLSRVFSIIVASVGLYVVVRGTSAIMSGYLPA